MRPIIILHIGKNKVFHFLQKLSPFYIDKGIKIAMIKENAEDIEGGSRKWKKIVTAGRWI